MGNTSKRPVDLYEVFPLGGGGYHFWREHLLGRVLLGSGVKINHGCNLGTTETVQVAGMGPSLFRVKVVWGVQGNEKTNAIQEGSLVENQKIPREDNITRPRLMTLSGIEKHERSFPWLPLL